MVRFREISDYVVFVSSGWGVVSRMPACHASALQSKAAIRMISISLFTVTGGSESSRERTYDFIIRPTFDFHDFIITKQQIDGCREWEW